MKMKKALLLLFLLLAGMVLGALVASACAGVSGLSWLGFSQNIGINPDAPFVVDAAIFQFSFAFSIEISVAQVLFIGLAVALYNVLANRSR